MKRTILGSTLLLITATGQLQSSDDAAVICRDAHVQTRMAIKTLRCRFEVSKPGTPAFGESAGTRRPAVVRTTVEFVQDGPTMISRVSELDGKLTAVYLWKEGVLKILRIDQTGNRTPDENKSGVLVDRQNYGEYFGVTPWFYGQFGMPGPEPPIPTDAQSVKSVTRESFRGADSFKVVAEDQLHRHVAWFNVDKNFLVYSRWRYLVKRADGFDETIRAEADVLGFREVAPGVFFPTAVERRDVRGGKSTIIDQVNFRDVRVNEPVDPAEFTLTFPENTNVTDLRTGKVYNTDSAEMPKGEVRLYVPPPPRGKEVPAYMQESSRRIWWWVGGGVIGAVLIAGVVIWRRQRGSSTS